MSKDVELHVWTHSKHSGSELLILLALADWSDGDGLSWHSKTNLAGKARIGIRATQRVLRNLEHSGELVVVAGGREGPFDTNLYWIAVPWSSLDEAEARAKRQAWRINTKTTPTTSVSRGGLQTTGLHDAGVVSGMPRGGLHDAGGEVCGPPKSKDQSKDEGPAPTSLDIAFVERMTERFGGELRPDTIPDRIAAALNYNQSRPVAKRWKDVEAGVRNWLIKDCDSLKGTKRPVKAAAPPELSLEERIKRGHQRNLENAERMRRAGIDYEWDDEPYPEEAKQ